MRLMKITFLFIITLSLFGCTPYTKGKLIKNDMQIKSALLVIDVQKDFIDKTGRLPVDQMQAEKVLKNINLLIDKFNSKNIDIIYIVNEFSPSDSIANFFRNNSAVRGSEGAKLSEKLTVINDVFFSKDHPDAFSNQKFDNYLRDKNISQLILTGVYADQCVFSTAKGANQRGYNVIIISDAVASKNNNNLNHAFENYKKNNIKILLSEDVEKIFNK